MCRSQFLNGGGSITWANLGAASIPEPRHGERLVIAQGVRRALRCTWKESNPKYPDGGYGWTVCGHCSTVVKYSQAAGAHGASSVFSKPCCFYGEEGGVLKGLEKITRVSRRYLAATGQLEVLRILLEGCKRTECPNFQSYPGGLGGGQKYFPSFKGGKSGGNLLDRP